MNTLTFTDSFDRASDNMDYDRSLLNSLTTQDGPFRACRIYIWKHPGITYSYKQDLPAELQHYDHAKRYTGGGIVFHSPGDIVFSTCARLDDPFFASDLKEKMHTITHIIATVFDTLQLPLSNGSSDSTEQNIDFCSTYHNPYELHYDNQKIAAITLRKNKSHFMTQGIIHLFDNHQDFDLPNSYKPYLSRGITNMSQANASTIQSALLDAIRERAFELETKTFQYPSDNPSAHHNHA